MEITFIRHAKTIKGKFDIIDCTNDPPLSEYGIKQAEQVKSEIDENSYDAVFTSDYKRTKQTVEAIFPKNSKVIVEENLMELNFGNIRGKYYNPINIFKMILLYIIKKNNLFGGESVKDFDLRCQNVYEKIRKMAKDNNWKKIAIVSHNGTILSILRNYLKILPKRKLFLDYTYVTKVKSS